MTSRASGYLFLALLVLLGVVPILSMVGSTFYNAQGFSLAGYSLLFKDIALWKSLGNSVVLAFSVAFFSTFVGTLLAILLHKTNLYARTLWLILLVIPLLLPPYIIAYGWYGLVGRQSMIGQYLFGFTGTAWVLFSVYVAIPTLLISLFLRQVNPHLEEVGLLTCSWGCVLKNITLPLIQPAIVFSFLLVFILSISELSVPNFLRYDVFVLHSFTQFSAFYDFQTATIDTMPLLLIILVILWLGYALPKRPLRFQNNATMLQLDVSSYQLRLNGIMFLLFMVLMGLPLWGLLSHIDVSSFMTAFEKSYPAIRQSLFYATIASLILLFLGFVSAYIMVYKSIKAWHWIQAVILFLFILSSILLGIALILFWNRPATNFIYGTSRIVFMAYGLKYLFLSSSIIQLKLKQIPSVLIEAATLSGASSRQILGYIILPLSKEALVVSTLIGFIFTLRESTLMMLVSPAGSTTLPLYIMTQMANGKEGIIASLCLIMILLILLPLFALLGYTRYKGTLDD